MVSLAVRDSPPERVAMRLHAPPSVRRYTSYWVIGGPLGSVAGQLIVTWAFGSPGTGSRGLSVGAGTLAGLPNDCAFTVGPKGPQPAPFLACTRMSYASLLMSPD